MNPVAKLNAKAGVRLVETVTAQSSWTMRAREESDTMKIADAAVLVTGANRGLGRALVEEALRRGAGQVYAGTRQPFAHSDVRVTPVIFDVTNAAQIREALGRVASLDLLINNAAVAQYDDLGDRAMLERHLAVNVLGLYDVTQAFLPLLTRSQGAVVNVISDSALTPVPFVPAYSMSKAAAFSLTQSMRALWAARGVSVHAAMAGPIDTDMSRDADIPKSSAETVARGILDGVESAEADIFPDSVSSALAGSWRTLATGVLEMRRSWQRK
jgi:NAD(P)-dependent dehydrogenase (short-subunit alcohol dehydrogenase family)